MQALPNIISTPGSGSLPGDDSGAAPAAHGQAGGKGQNFAQLMNQALSAGSANPSAAANPAISPNLNSDLLEINAAQMDTARFLFAAKGSKSAATSSKNETNSKKIDSSATPANTTVTTETAVPVENQALPVPTFIPDTYFPTPQEAAWIAQSVGVLNAQSQNLVGAAGTPPGKTTTRPAKTAATTASNNTETKNTEAKTAPPPTLAATNSKTSALAASLAPAQLPALPTSPVKDGATKETAVQAAAKDVELPAASGTVNLIKSTAATTGTPGVESKNANPAPVNNDGTPAAQQDTSMNSSEKMTKTTATPGKNLPGATGVSLRENNLPPRADLTAAAAASRFQADHISATAPSPILSVTGTGTVLVPVASSANLVDRTQALIAQQASRVAASSPNSLQVVVTPADGTQLSLDLRQRGNSIEVQVVMQQGDFHALNQHWPQLQQQLEQRGVRLAPLAEQTDVSTGSHGDFSGQTSNQPSKMAFDETSADLALSAPPGATMAKSAPAASRGWETWA